MELLMMLCPTKVGSFNKYSNKLGIILPLDVQYMGVIKFSSKAFTKKNCFF